VALDRGLQAVRPVEVLPLRPQDGDAFAAVIAKPFQIPPLLALIDAHLGRAP